MCSASIAWNVKDKFCISEDTKIENTSSPNCINNLQWDSTALVCPPPVFSPTVQCSPPIPLPWGFCQTSKMACWVYVAQVSMYTLENMQGFVTKRSQMSICTHVSMYSSTLNTFVYTLHFTMPCMLQFDTDLLLERSQFNLILFSIMI